MHRSRVAGFIIDCRNADLESAATFWSGVLGMEKRALPGSEGEKYVRLMDPGDRLDVEVQLVDHESRVHIDIETDDVEAEVLRLEKLGAKRVLKLHSWWVMQAPTGHRFCVVRSRGSDFATNSNTWD